MNSIILNQAEKPEALEEKTLLALQIAQLQRLYAVNGAMAEVLSAPLAFTAAGRP